jgi:hypothetical protein
VQVGGDDAANILDLELESRFGEIASELDLHVAAGIGHHGRNLLRTGQLRLES